MIVGGYDLHLYCDNGPKCIYKLVNGEPKASQYAGPDKADCYRQARNAGWTVYRGKCACRQCNLAKGKS